MQTGSSTLREMYDQAHALVGVNASAGTQAKLRASFNRHMDAAARSMVWPVLEVSDELGLRTSDDSDDYFIAAGDPFVPLPYGCDNVQCIVLHDPKREITETSPANIARRWTVSESGIPQLYAIVGETALHTKLSADDLVEIWADTSANDNLATVRVTFVPSNGLQGEVVQELLTGTFSTGVAVTQAALAGWNIHSVETDGNWSGGVTIKTAAGAEVGRFGGYYLPAAGEARHRRFARPLARLGPAPESATKATVIWRRTPRKLEKLDDSPDIPISDYLVYMAAADYMRVLRRHPEANSFASQANGLLAAPNTTDPAPEETAPSRGDFLSQTGYIE